ncbi:NUDIX hydrolase [soil metagenome]
MMINPTPNHYKYPTAPQVAVGGVVIHKQKILLIKRLRSPNQGLWAVPGGKVELGETLQQTAERELLEETGIVVRATTPCYTFDYIERDETNKIGFHYVIIDLFAEYVSGVPQAQSDASEAAWIAFSDLDSLAMTQSTRELLLDTLQLR